MSEYSDVFNPVWLRYLLHCICLDIPCLWKDCQWTVWGDVGAEAFLCCSSKLSFLCFFDVKTSLWCCHSSEHPYTHTAVRNIFIYSCKIAGQTVEESQRRLVTCVQVIRTLLDSSSHWQKTKMWVQGRREKLIPMYCIVHVMVELNFKCTWIICNIFGTTHP